MIELITDTDDIQPDAHVDPPRKSKLFEWLLILTKTRKKIAMTMTD